jgi:hypothetical protein
VRADWHQNSACRSISAESIRSSSHSSSHDGLGNEHRGRSGPGGDHGKPLARVDEADLDGHAGAELRESLASLTKREARLFERGHHLRVERTGRHVLPRLPAERIRERCEPKQALCRIGMAQEVTCAHLLAQRAVGV